MCMISEYKQKGVIAENLLATMPWLWHTIMQTAGAFAVYVRHAQSCQTIHMHRSLEPLQFGSTIFRPVQKISRDSNRADIGECGDAQD